MINYNKKATSIIIEKKTAIKTCVEFSALLVELLILTIIDVVVAIEPARATGVWIYDDFRQNMVLPVQIILLVLCVMITVVRINTHKSLSLVLLLTAVPLFYIFSEEFFVILGISPKVQQYTVYLTALLLITTYYYHLSKTNMLDRPNKKYELIWLSTNVVTMIVYMTVNVVAVRVIMTTWLILSTLPAFYMINVKNAKGDLLASAILALAVGLSALQLLKTAGLLNFAYTLVFAFGTIIISFSVALFFVLQSYRDDKLALQKAELEKMVSEVKSRALLSQIKPDLIFNSLSLIKEGYHTSREDGDLAMDLFSRHLRANVDANITEMVDIEVELDLIGNYFELENLRQNNNANLLFDIGIKNFCVPVLSLQPIVENSMRHAALHLVKDGGITIKTYKKEEYVCIEVADNGRGFDATQTGYERTGLINAKERLYYALNAQVVIESEIGKGTTTNILIPLENARGYVQEENI